MEAIPTTFPTWDHFNSDLHEPIKMLRSSEGEKLALEENFFIEKLLPNAILRDLTDFEHEQYRKPFLNKGEARRATLSGPRQLPIAGKPEATVKLIDDYSNYLSNSFNIPKLFINAEPGAFLVGYARDFVRTLPNLKEVTVSGHHFIQEDSPKEIGEALLEWIDNLQ
ncbi:hypothetical protein [Aeromonas salmonicida]|nr:hypothetical protein [Aeromonas salmonicida]